MNGFLSDFLSGGFLCIIKFAKPALEASSKPKSFNFFFASEISASLLSSAAPVFSSGGRSLFSGFSSDINKHYFLKNINIFYPEFESFISRGHWIFMLNFKDDGYRGICYFNQPSEDEYVFKYSGGLGTYPSNHIP